jgi:hypothetical protein
MESSTRYHRSALTLAVALLGLICSSCSKNEHLPVYSVQGQVLVDGKPAEQAVVALHSLDEDPIKHRISPTGVVDASGNFSLSTYAMGDGAPAGDYGVSIIWRKPTVRSDEDQPDLLPTHYRNAATSGIRVKVQQGSNQLEPFRLSKSSSAAAAGPAAGQMRDRSSR